MRVVKKDSGKRREGRAKRLDSSAQMKARDDDISCRPRVVFVNTLNSAKKLRKIKKNHHSLRNSLQLTQKVLQRMREEIPSKKKHLLTESSREVAEARKQGAERQGKELQDAESASGTRLGCKNTLWLFTDRVQSGTGVGQVGDI